MEHQELNTVAPIRKAERLKHDVFQPQLSHLVDHERRLVKEPRRKILGVRHPGAMNLRRKGNEKSLLEAVAIRLEAVAIRLEAVAIRLEVFALI